jgi:hypothetical protein
MSHRISVSSITAFFFSMAVWAVRVWCGWVDLSLSGQTVDFGRLPHTLMPNRGPSRDPGGDCLQYAVCCVVILKGKPFETALGWRDRLVQKAWMGVGSGLETGLHLWH